MTDDLKDIGTSDFIRNLAFIMKEFKLTSLKIGDIEMIKNIHDDEDEKKKKVKEW